MWGCFLVSNTCLTRHPHSWIRYKSCVDVEHCAGRIGILPAKCSWVGTATCSTPQNISRKDWRRINTEEKAKVVAAVWGDRIAWRIGWIGPGWFEENNEFFLFFKIVQVQNSWRGKELNKFCPPKSSDDLCLFFCNYSSSMTERKQRLQEIHSWVVRSPKFNCTERRHR